MNIYDDKNYTHYGANHPKLPGIAYFDKHVQPSGNSEAGNVLSSVNILFYSVHVRTLGNGKFMENVGNYSSNRRHSTCCI